VYRLLAIAVATTLTVLAACGSGSETATTTTQRPTTTTVLRTTTTRPPSPLEALTARPHTMAECMDAYRTASESFGNLTDCVDSASDIPVAVRSGLLLEVNGSGTALLTYSLSGGNLAQEEVTLPWSLEVANPQQYEGQQLLAQLNGTGDITCRILSQTNSVLAEVTSSGAYVIATCSHIEEPY